MEYEIFKREVKELLKACLPEKYQSWEFEERQVHKINETLDGFYLQPKETAKRVGPYPTFYYQECYDMLKMGVPMENILRNIAFWVMAAPEDMEMEQVDLTVFRDDIVCVVINQKGNEALLETIPHRKFLDLAVIYRVYCFAEDGSRSGMLVTNDYLKTLGMSLEELHEKAMAYTLELLPPNLNRIDDSLGRTFAFGTIPEKIPVFMLSNEFYDYGASMLLYTHILDMAAEIVGGNFYILPGSIHELYLIPENPKKLSFYRDLVQHANQVICSRQEWLSDNIYFYDKERQRLTLAEDFPV